MPRISAGNTWTGPSTDVNPHGSTLRILDLGKVNFTDRRNAIFHTNENRVKDYRATATPKFPVHSFWSVLTPPACRLKEWLFYCFSECSRTKSYSSRLALQGNFIGRVAANPGIQYHPTASEENVSIESLNLANLDWRALRAKLCPAIASDRNLPFPAYHDQCRRMNVSGTRNRYHKKTECSLCSIPNDLPDGPSQIFVVNPAH
jgi:hypothetical protein